MTSHRPALSPRGCTPPEHALHRRLFLQGLAAGGATASLSWKGLFGNESLTAQAKSEQKHVILLWLCGAPSQFETWDPKPKSCYGGPFKSIPTKLPGVHFSSLMPQCAAIADQLSIVRSMKTKPNEHLEGIELLNRGSEPRPPFIRPTLGSVLGNLLQQADSPIPNFVLLDPNAWGNEFKQFKAGNWGGWLGATTAPVRSGGEFKPSNVNRVADMSSDSHDERELLRRLLTNQYDQERKSHAAASQNAAFASVKGMMSCAHLFDLDQIPEEERRRYGPGNFAQHTLLARNLVENGAPFVMVANGMPWDSHMLNHEMHQMLVPELDAVIVRLLTDLKERGLLDSTLVVMMGEFGRTPWLNLTRGRDHYSEAWSLALAGCGIKPGVVVGATDEDGVDVADRPIDEKNLFATIFKALGFDPYAEYDLPNLPTFHRVEDEAEPIHEVLA